MLAETFCSLSIFYYKTCKISTEKVIARVRQLLIETRVRLVTGLKRYLHTKHGEGLLSAGSVQVRPCAVCAAAWGAGARVYLQWGFSGERGDTPSRSYGSLCSLTGLRLTTFAFPDLHQ